ncbi:MAG: PBP1A family penicillin-binding protein [Chitinispirillia bacterium]|nr:PBP1A family penicillin-binding protein [Chitinispirillia bacterium]MCL2268712.1 PBP1A family penicillin-binding protein [Chitinispirillia bacterium]
MRNEKEAVNNSESGGGRSRKQVGIRGLWIFLLILIVIPVTSFSAVAGSLFIYRLYESLPTHTQLQNIEQSVVSKVLDKDGKPIHEFSVERRFWVPLENIPKDLQNAVISIEDRRFYKHWGINVERNLGAVLANVTRGKLAQGASTITQQLARNLYLTSDKTFIRKIREVLTAVQLESTYTKPEILELYLNQAYLGAGVYGVQAAAEHYYNKGASELTLNECAVIAGIIQRPEHHRPDRPANTERITARRNVVLRSMVVTKSITKAAAQAAIDEPVVANPKVYAPPAAPYFIEMVRRYVADKYGDDQLYNAGLVIQTTLDPIAQDSAEASAGRQVALQQARLNRIFIDANKLDRVFGMNRDMVIASFDSLYALKADEYAKLHDTLKLRKAQIAVVALDVKTGAIRTLIGGRDFQESRFNRVTQARRQAGSAFKPFVYSAALENGINPATVILDQPITLVTPEGEWRPENYDRTFSGPMTVRDALAKSNNLVAIQVFNRVGGQTVVDHAQRMKIRPQSLHTGPSLAIGACEVTPMEITSSYGIYANRGIYVPPYFIERITDRNGRVLEEATPKEEEVLSPSDAFLMTSLLGSVVCCGTGARIRSEHKFTRPAGGKTGTTNDYSDAWFVGFTPQIVCGVWVGIDDRLSMGYGVTGTVAAVPVWSRAMIALHRDLPVQDFRRPEGVKGLSICSQSSGLAGASCPRTKVEVFRSESVVDSCTVHGIARGLRDGGAGMDIFGPSRRGGSGSTGGSSGSGGGEQKKQDRNRSMF